MLIDALSSKTSDGTDQNEEIYQNESESMCFSFSLLLFPVKLPAQLCSTAFDICHRAICM